MRTHTVIDSPIGPLTLVNTDGVLSGVYMDRQARRPADASFGERTETGFDGVIEQLREYFAGIRTEFTLPAQADGNTFEHYVWQSSRRSPTARLGRMGRSHRNWAIARWRRQSEELSGEIPSASSFPATG